MNNLNCYQIFRLINKLHGSVSSMVDARGFTVRVVLPLCIPTVRNIIKMDTDMENENQRFLFEFRHKTPTTNGFNLIAKLRTYDALFYQLMRRYSRFMLCVSIALLLIRLIRCYSLM